MAVARLHIYMQTPAAAAAACSTPLLLLKLKLPPYPSLFAESLSGMHDEDHDIIVIDYKI